MYKSTNVREKMVCIIYLSLDTEGAGAIVLHI